MNRKGVSTTRAESAISTLNESLEMEASNPTVGFAARRGKVIALLLGLAIGAGLLGFYVSQANNAYGSNFVGPFPQTGRVDKLLITGDGQAIASTARKSLYVSAYRWSKPLPQVLAWLVGLGNPKWIPYAMLVVALAGCGILAWGVAECIEPHAPEWTWLGGLAVLFPGVISTLTWYGPEALGVGIALIGWRRKNWFLLTLAGLVRETLLGFSLHRKKLIPFLAYALVVMWAIHSFHWWSFPQHGVFGFLDILSAPHPHDVGYEHWLAIGLTYALGFTAVVGGGEERQIAVLYLLLSVFLGRAGWAYWHDPARYLLPLWAMGYVSIIKMATRKEPRVKASLAASNEIAAINL